MAVSPKQRRTVDLPWELDQALRRRADALAVSVNALIVAVLREDDAAYETLGRTSTIGEKEGRP